MEFRFNLNDIFRQNISKIDCNLFPLGLTGDKRSIMDCTSKIAQIIDEIGDLSAKAQDLQHPITSAEKLKNSDHILYLMVDEADNDGKGSVVGLLKIGVKNLFLFDETGMVHEKKCMCILDFYIHESKQRTGLGKKMYDYMLHDNKIEPCKLAIDRPSEKFLLFLHKHYGLGKIYPQTNNFVLFEGFFDDKSETDSSVDLDTIKHHGSQDSYHYDNSSVTSEGYEPTLYGRHSAFKPSDTMGKVLGCCSPSPKITPVKMNHHTTLW